MGHPEVWSSRPPDPAYFSLSSGTLRVGGSQAVPGKAPRRGHLPRRGCVGFRPPLSRQVLRRCPSGEAGDWRPGEVCARGLAVTEIRRARGPRENSARNALPPLPQPPGGVCLRLPARLFLFRFSFRWRLGLPGWKAAWGGDPSGPARCLPSAGPGRAALATQLRGGTEPGFSARRGRCWEFTGRCCFPRTPTPGALPTLVLLTHFPPAAAGRATPPSRPGLQFSVALFRSRPHPPLRQGERERPVRSPLPRRPGPPLPRRARVSRKTGSGSPERRVLNQASSEK